METRTGNLIISTSGGTAGGKANNYKVALPSTWVQEMGLDTENRQMELSFDGTSITITKKLSFSEFKARPFQTTFNRQIHTMENLYRKQLEIPSFTREQLAQMVKPLLEYYHDFSLLPQMHYLPKGPEMA